jgi:hypothetical protein
MSSFFFQNNGLPKFSLFVMQLAALLIPNTILTFTTSYHILKQTHDIQMDINAGGMYINANENLLTSSNLCR